MTDEEEFGGFLSLMAQPDDPTIEELDEIVEERMIVANVGEAEHDPTAATRPTSFEEFTGNREVVGILRREIAGAKRFRGGRLRNTLLTGVAGTGKTTLAEIIANECGGHLISTTGSALKKPKEMAETLLKLKFECKQNGKLGILFIDEIHEMGSSQMMGESELLPLFERGIFHCPSIQTAEIIDSAGQRFMVEVGGEIRMDVPWTAIGATTDPQMLTGAMRRRFKCQCFMAPYQDEDMVAIIQRYSQQIGIPIDYDAADFLARRSRANPAKAISLVESCQNRCAVEDMEYIDFGIAHDEMASQGVRFHGLTEIDLKVLGALRDSPLTARGTRSGLSLSSLAAAVGLSSPMVQDMIEPYLKQRGLIVVTSRRQITQKGIDLLEGK